MVEALASNNDADGALECHSRMVQASLRFAFTAGFPSFHLAGLPTACLVSSARGAYEVIQEALADPQTANLVNAVTYSSVLKSFNHQKRFHRVWDPWTDLGSVSYPLVPVVGTTRNRFRHERHRAAAFLKETKRIAQRLRLCGLCGFCGLRPSFFLLFFGCSFAFFSSFLRTFMTR